MVSPCLRRGARNRLQRAEVVELIPNPVFVTRPNGTVRTRTEPLGSSRDSTFAKSSRRRWPVAKVEEDTVGSQRR